MAEILDSRADLTDVAEKRPDLAGRVLAAQVELGRGEPHPTPGEADPEAWVRAPVGDADRCRQADADLQQAPVVVRQQPGFASFLLPRRSPTCSQLSRQLRPVVAQRGPVGSSGRPLGGMALPLIPHLGQA